MVGWSELIFGSMYCGKSEELIRRLKRVKIAGQKYQLFKPAIDNRYGEEVVATHENNEVKKRVEKILDVHINEDLKATLTEQVVEQLSGAMEATVVSNPKEILDNIHDDTEVVGIDEVQFFNQDLIEVVEVLVRRGKRVIMAGLDLYASGQPWPIIPHLACSAKYVEKLHAVCVDCGRDAYISYMLKSRSTEKTVDIGSTGKYIALCENCAHKRNNK
jgi:thymidine kinase